MLRSCSCHLGYVEAGACSGLRLFRSGDEHLNSAAFATLAKYHFIAPALVDVDRMFLILGQCSGVLLLPAELLLLLLVPDAKEDT